MREASQVPDHQSWELSSHRATWHHDLNFCPTSSWCSRYNTHLDVLLMTHEQDWPDVQGQDTEKHQNAILYVWMWPNIGMCSLFPTGDVTWCSLVPCSLAKCSLFPHTWCSTVPCSLCCDTPYLTKYRDVFPFVPTEMTHDVPLFPVS